jgi:hypothetical protein
MEKKIVRLVKNETLVITDNCYVSHEDRGYNALISANTIYGDWSCMCYKGTKEEVQELTQQWNEYYFKFFHEYNWGNKTEDEKKSIYEQFKKKQKEWISEHCYGQFCADSGNVSVFELSVIRKKYPEFEKWAEEHPWCVCFVPDYTGEVAYIVEEEENEKGEIDKSAHIVGTGNKKFYTTQSGL